MMIKRYLTGLIAAVLVMTLVSCGDEETHFGEPLLPVGTLAGELVWQSNTIGELLPTEMGCFLEPVRSGRITGLCVQAPAEDVYRVTFWDTADTSVLASVNISAAMGALICQDIAPVEVLAGRRYAITMLTRHWYTFTSPSGLPIYRALVGDVEVVSFATRYHPEGFELPGSHAHNWLKGMADAIYEPLLE